MAEKPNTTELDINQLGERTRVFAMAKMLGMSSKELIIELDKIGLVKVAQSSLTKDEAAQLLEVLRSDTPDPEPENGEESPEVRIRKRVENNVKNEISQIEEKVDKQLASYASEELLEEIVPEITPAPEDPSAAAAPMPLFIPPAVDAAAPEEAAPAAEKEKPRREDKPRERKSRKSNEDKREDKPAKSKKLPQKDTDPEPIDEPKAIKGSTRLEAQRRRRSERREARKNERHIVSEAEFLARRESVERTMVVREKERTDHPGRVTQVGVLEDGMLVEHFVTSDTQSSMVGNIYLGRVQNVLPSMEAAFIDIGKGRNGVLYAGEVDWRAAGLGGRRRTIEHALKSGDQVLVQVVKDPIGHKGARLSTQISLAGRFLVYVPGGRTAGISRKLPAPERARLKDILKRVVPEQGGAIIRTAAEGVSEEAIAADVARLHAQWEQIDERTKKEKSSKGAKPVAMYEEPNMLVKVIRDLFNEDFSHLVVDGSKAWNTVYAYVHSVASDLEDRMEKYDPKEHGGVDAFEHYRVDEQLSKALSRKVWLPSGGTLVIDRTEAMTVVDVNTGKFTGTGGNLEETVTQNNLEAAEEIVRQMRLRDLGGMIVVDFIDMVLPENQDLVLRRLKEALGRDRTRHQVSEVTSLGLVQMTRKKLGTGLLDTFATECEHCDGRGLIIHTDPVEQSEQPAHKPRRRGDKSDRSERREKNEKNDKQDKKHSSQDPASHPAALAMHREEESEKSIEELADAVISLNSQADNAEDSAENAEREEKSEKRQRRGRRRSTKRTNTKRSADNKDSAQAEEPAKKKRSEKKRAEESSAEDVRAIVAKAVHTADAEDPDEPSGADYTPASFDEAMAEFERSPRRKRATRGNSRSDHAPKREDFEPAQPSADKAEETEEAADSRDSRDSGDGFRRPSSRRSRGGRRRSSTRGARSEENRSPAPQSEPAPSESQQHADKDESEDSSPRRRRGRRRVVRKNSRAEQAPAKEQASEKRQSEKRQPEKRQSEKRQAASASKGRRRRATRRSTNKK
ncbi:translation initiation factor IF-2 N-terminal domain-containing protein [Corynebacterium sp. 12B]|uniref:translation initiation factor IF-2 N-terminal domain-containing protein n=1 Tax=Corynebacterium sp. 12B TaxID=2080509 RepID=UPI00124D3670|nr:translation initiation factor IF-2 N-terminal domain-containing protein [Corynebacterium sp. 12B]